MNPVFANNPDGSAAVLTPEYVQRRQTSPAPTDPPFKIQRNPFPEHDQVAAENLERMKQQDHEAWKEHSPAEPEFAKIFRQDADAIAEYETFISYTAPTVSSDDHAIRAAIAATDTLVQQSAAEHAAGPNPIVADPNAFATPGMDWLERMRAEDARIQRAMVENDAQMRAQK